MCWFLTVDSFNSCCVCLLSSTSSRLQLETSRKTSTRNFIIHYEWLWILIVFTKYLPCGSVFSLTSRRAILLPDLLFDWQPWEQHKNAVCQSGHCFWDESFDGHLEVFGENKWWSYGYEWQVWLVCGARGPAAFI